MYIYISIHSHIYILVKSSIENVSTTNLPNTCVYIYIGLSENGLCVNHGRQTSRQNRENKDKPVDSLFSDNPPKDPPKTVKVLYFVTRTQFLLVQAEGHVDGDYKPSITNYRWQYYMILYMSGLGGLAISWCV